ncbi:MAG: ABC transporter ATP-binding protein [Clostridia bacterium]|nr:ABC transporter ATP-binding protein [Clostridia bacterium]
MITFSGVTKRYGDKLAADGLSFTVEKGQVLGLLGQNGAGKTTALSILTGCLAPTAGTVNIGGHDLLREPRQAKRLLGYLPEVPPLHDEMTVRAALRFACELKMVVAADILPHIEEIAAQCGLGDMLGHRVGNLSRGYRQRVGLAQALCGDPEVLVLDEPTNTLDPRQTAEFRDTLWRLSQGRTVIFSSHILSEVQSLCDRVIILHHGRVACDSSLRELRRDGAVRLRLDALGSEKRLLPALRELAGVQNVTPLPAPEPGVVSALIEYRQGVSRPQPQLCTLLNSLNAPILRLQEAESTLEEIFLRVTAEG